MKKLVIIVSIALFFSKASIVNAAGQMCCAGVMPTSSTVCVTSLSFGDFQFTDLPVQNISATELEQYHTVVLLQVYTSTLTPQQKIDINKFVDNGGKLVIYASDTTGISGANKVITLEEKDNGTEIRITNGDIIQIELKRSGGTGYEYYLDRDYKDYFELIKDEKKEILRKGFVGTPVMRCWQLKAVKQGDTELVLRLYRDWEGKKNAASMFRVRVKIH